MNKIFLSSVLVAILLLPMVTFAEEKKAETLKDVLLTPVSDTATGANFAEPVTIPQAIGGLINSFLGVFSVYFLFRLVFAGYLWFMAKGNEEQVKKAIGIMKGAVAGVLIALLSGVLVYLITSIKI